MTRTPARRPANWARWPSFANRWTTRRCSTRSTGPSDRKRMNLATFCVLRNGEPDKLEVRTDIRKGGESREIDLKGAGKRSLRKIEFWYETKGILRGKADVTVLGMK